MPDRDRLITLERVGLVDVFAIRQRLRKQAWNRRNIDPKQPELALLGLRQRSCNQMHKFFFLRPPFFCRFLGFGNYKQVFDPIINTAVLSSKLCTQAIGHKLSTCGICQDLKGRFLTAPFHQTEILCMGKEEGDELGGFSFEEGLGKVSQTSENHFDGYLCQWTP